MNYSDVSGNIKKRKATKTSDRTRIRSIRVAKSAAQLICAFVFAYA